VRQRGRTPPGLTTLQGSLTHKKPRPPSTLQWDYAWGPRYPCNVVSPGFARTPASSCSSSLSSRHRGKSLIRNYHPRWTTVGPQAVCYERSTPAENAPHRFLGTRKQVLRIFLFVFLLLRLLLLVPYTPSPESANPKTLNRRPGGKGNSNSHDARPFHQIISMISLSGVGGTAVEPRLMASLALPPPPPHHHHPQPHITSTLHPITYTTYPKPQVGCGWHRGCAPSPGFSLTPSPSSSSSASSSSSLRDAEAWRACPVSRSAW